MESEIAPHKNKGWSPIMGEVIISSKESVIKIVDWTEGTGVKPKKGLYIGIKGLVKNKKEALRVPSQPSFEQIVNKIFK